MISVASFGDWICRRRRTMGLTQKEQAHCASCSVSAIRKIESDERRPSRQLAQLLAHCLAVPSTEHDTFLQVARGERPVERLAAPQTPLSASWPRPVTSLPVSNLPLLPTPLVGREAELATLGRMLRNPNCRLLTLIGPGGIGKTHLALAAASQAEAAQLDIFADGVYFISLAPISTAAFLVPTIADAIGFSFYGRDTPEQQLLGYLRGKQMLLLLDNFEHRLAPHVAPIGRGEKRAEEDGAASGRDALRLLRAARLVSGRNGCL